MDNLYSYLAIIGSYLFSSLIFLLILGLVVLIHELGHFVAAKLIGAKVEEFAFGFGQSIWKKQYGDTVYKWNIWPLGGYCTIMGESQDVNDPRSFSTKTPLQRIFVLVAGVLMNFVLAIIVFFIYFVGNSWQVKLVANPESPDFKFIGAETILQITRVAKDSPASRANLPENGIIKEVNNQPVSSYRFLIDKIGESYGKELVLDIEKDSKISEYYVTVDQKNDSGRAVIGVGIDYLIDYSDSKYLAGVYHAYDTVVYNLWGLGHIYNKSVEDGNLNYASESTGSIAKIAQITHGLVKYDQWSALVYLVGLLSATLSIMNMLPLLPLDGGHVFFILLETVIRRKISDKAKGIIAMIGLGFFLLLFVVLFVKDVRDFSIVRNFLGLFGVKY